MNNDGELDDDIEIDTEREIALKQIAAELVRTMLDNHSGDWDHDETARAFVTIYEAVESA